MLAWQGKHTPSSLGDGFCVSVLSEVQTLVSLTLIPYSLHLMLFHKSAARIHYNKTPNISILYNSL